MRPVNGLRGAVVPVLAVALVGGVLGAQIAAGGGTFTPLRPSNPCSVREVTSVSTGIDGLTERVVLLGLDEAACRLRTTREALLLQLAQTGPHTDTELNALRAGLLDAINRMNTDRTLPAASDLIDQAVDRSSLNGFLKAGIRALPGSVINKALSTDSVLHDTINDLDLRTLLANLHNPDDLTEQLNSAVTRAVEQSLLARVRGLL